MAWRPVWRPIGFRAWARAMLRRHHSRLVHHYPQRLIGLLRIEMSDVESGRMMVSQRGARARWQSDITVREIAGRRSYPPDCSAVHSCYTDKPSSSDSSKYSSESSNYLRTAQTTTPLSNVFGRRYFSPAYVSFPTANLRPQLFPQNVGAACESACRWRNRDKVPGS